MAKAQITNTKVGFITWIW